jgi:hypothetical protein
MTNVELVLRLRTVSVICGTAEELIGDLYADYPVDAADMRELVTMLRSRLHCQISRLTEVKVDD